MRCRFPEAVVGEHFLFGRQRIVQLSSADKGGGSRRSFHGPPRAIVKPDSQIGSLGCLDARKRSDARRVRPVYDAVEMPRVETGFAVVQQRPLRQRVGVEILVTEGIERDIFETIMIGALVAVADEGGASSGIWNHIVWFLLQKTSSLSAQGKRKKGIVSKPYPKIAQLLCAFTIAETVRGPGLGVEPPDKVKLFGREKALLTFDDDHAVSVDGFSQLRERLVVQVLKVCPIDNGSELLARSVKGRMANYSLSQHTLVFLSGPCSKGRTTISAPPSSACGMFVKGTLLCERICVSMKLSCRCAAQAWRRCPRAYQSVRGTISFSQQDE